MQDVLNAVMTIKEVSDVFGPEVSTVRKACLSGELPARKSGSTWLIRRVDAEKRFKKGTDK